MPDTALLHMVPAEDRTRCGNVIHRHSDVEHAVYWEESKLRYMTACGLVVPHRVDESDTWLPQRPWEWGHDLRKPVTCRRCLRTGAAPTGEG